MTTTCHRPGCLEPAEVRGHCTPHYTKLHGAGVLRPCLIDAGPVRKRIDTQLHRGRTYRSLAIKAGVDNDTVHYIHTGVTSRVRSLTAQRIIAVPLTATDVGCVRRIHALQRLGYSLPGQAQHMGTAYGGLRGALLAGYFRDWLRDLVTVAYDQLQGTPGPSRIAAGKARVRGHAPPLAWHGVDIDDPTTVPDTGPATRVTAADRVAEIEHLLSLGVDLDVACERVGIKPASLSSMRGRLAQRTPAAVIDLWPLVTVVVCTCGARLTTEQTQRRWTECMTCWRQQGSSGGAA